MGGRRPGTAYSDCAIAIADKAPMAAQQVRHVIGWRAGDDPVVVVRVALGFDEALAAGGAAKVSDSIRLFMVPGMGHCAGGEGPGNFDKLTPLEQWVEQKTAPDRILATRPATKDVLAATRPLCPYPLVAVYSGTGSTNDAANFVCRAR